VVWGFDRDLCRRRGLGSGPASAGGRLSRRACGGRCRRAGSRRRRSLDRAVPSVCGPGSGSRHDRERRRRFRRARHEGGICLVDGDRLRGRIRRHARGAGAPRAGRAAAPPTAPVAEFGAQRGWILLLVLLVWAFDTGAYCVGIALGKRKFLAHISPSKSYWGLFGGLVASTAVAVAGLWLSVSRRFWVSCSGRSSVPSHRPETWPNRFSNGQRARRTPAGSSPGTGAYLIAWIRSSSRRPLPRSS